MNIAMVARQAHRVLDGRQADTVLSCFSSAPCVVCPEGGPCTTMNAVILNLQYFTCINVHSGRGALEARLMLPDLSG